MNSTSSRLRLYALLTALLTIAVAAARSVALLAAFDADIGYFREGSPLVVALYIMEGFFLLVAILPAFLVGKDQLDASPAPLSMPGLIGSGVTALVALLVAFLLFGSLGSSAAPVGLLFFAALFFLVVAAYFAMGFLAQSVNPSTTCLLGYGALLGMACLLAVTYFDRYTTMNAPHKISLHLSLLTMMLYLIYEIRPIIGRPLPRALLIASAVALFFNASCGISNVVAFLAGRYDSMLYLSADLFSLAFALYAGARLFGICLSKKQ